MKVELTLHIKEEILREAEEYVRKYNRSLTRVIEASLNRLTMELPEDEDNDRTPIVNRLAGILGDSPDFDFKEEMGKYLVEDYK